ncbi:MAG: Ig domain-containing protein [Clostridia bacterium]
MKNRVTKIAGIFLSLLMLSSCGGKEGEERAVPVLSESNVKIELGGTSELDVLNYQGDITWSSSDEKIVTVSDEGVITPVAIGTAAVTAYIENSENMSCVVDVVAGTSNVQSIRVTSYYSDADDVTLNYNDSPTVLLKADCFPDVIGERLTWTSSDNSIAQVNQSGVVTGYDNGTVQITATALNGVSGTCMVRLKNVPASAKNEMPDSDMQAPRVDSSHSGVVKSSVPVASPNAQSTVIISDKMVYLEIGEGLLLTCAVGNAPANTTVQWLSSDKSIAVVKDGRVVAVDNGQCVISAVTSDGAVASCSVAVGKDAIKELKAQNSGK